jgi:asparagine synthase (glutamine-hydrolysing)
VLSFDGRLDNYRELADQLGLPIDDNPDSNVILRAFAKWGDDCFRRFTGDWALALWSKDRETLYLARDHAGTRTLFYRHEAARLEWATHLETFFCDRQMPPPSPTYIAAYLAGQQIRDLTPYKDICAVPPGHFLAFKGETIISGRHWSALGEAEIRYGADEEYDARFLALFKEAVRRRTENGAPIIAELSGGMDSTSAVCVSDHLRQMKDPGTPLLDTVSYYDDEEASLDERRYFSITEERRGKKGTHLDMAYSQRTFLPHDRTKGLYLVPGADSLSILREERFDELVWKKGYRAILSGIGGDELLGGVPDRNPELSGYLTAGRWGSLIEQSIRWSLIDRDPVIETIFDVIRFTAGSYVGQMSGKPAPPWLATPLKEVAIEHGSRMGDLQRRWEYTPRQLDNERTWWAVMETLPNRFPRLLTRPEYFYPYLDKDLVNYLFCVPRAQLLQPGRRRTLMRRALRGIVPVEILERKQKAFQLRAPLLKLQQAHETLRALFASSILVEMRCIEVGPFHDALEQTCAGNTTYWQGLMNTIALELWLQSYGLTYQNITFHQVRLQR